MPLTPFHLGPALLLGVLLYYWVDVPTLLVASVIVDVRAALVLFGPLDGPVHGILTTFVGGTFVALLVGGIALALPPTLQRLGNPLRPANTVAPVPIFFGAWLGVVSHVLLDALLYGDVQPFWPLAANPFLLDPAVGLVVVYGFCTLAGGFGAGALYRLTRRPPQRV